MADDLNCKLCSEMFQKWKSGGWNRKMLTAKLPRSDVTVYAVLRVIYDYKENEEGHICGACYSQIAKACKENIEHHTKVSTPNEVTERKRKVVTPCKTPQALKRHKTTSSPCKRTCTPLSCKVHPFPPNGTTCKTKTKASTTTALQRAVNKGNYFTGLRYILSKGASAQRAFRKLVRKTIKAEIRTFMKLGKYPYLEGISSISQFKWMDLVEQMQNIMPTLMHSLGGSMPTKCPEEKRSTILARTGFMVSIALYTANPRKFQFLQTLNGVQMWRCGSSEKLFKSLNHLGVCQSRNSIRTHVDTLCEEGDIELKKCIDALMENVGEEEINDIGAYSEDAYSEDDENMSKISQEIKEKVTANVDEAQEKQKQQYAQRSTKGIKVFELKVGDEVLRHNAAKKSHVGNQMEADWFGPYLIESIKSGKYQLRDSKTKKLLGRSYPHDQLKHYITPAPAPTPPFAQAWTRGPTADPKQTFSVTRTCTPVPNSTPVSTPTSILTPTPVHTSILPNPTFAPSTAPAPEVDSISLDCNNVVLDKSEDVIITSQEKASPLWKGPDPLPVKPVVPIRVPKHF